MNTGASWPSLVEARARVLEIQTKLHRWAGEDQVHRFDDLYNLVCDPAFLVVAWSRVRGNKGARTAGVDGQTAHYIEQVRGAEAFLDDLRGHLKARTFQPVPVRERMIPKPGTRKRRRLGIPTVADRVVQASVKLVLEPIFEADFQPCSYGFRPNRRAHDAIAEIHLLATKHYTWVLEADIEACFDTIDHTALMGRLRRRVGDKRVLALVKAFLKAGILSEDQVSRDTPTGTPQGGILSPLLANIALSVLDDVFAGDWATLMGSKAARQRRRYHGIANYRLVRYADDFVVMVIGDRADAEAVRARVTDALTPMGLHLSEAKTQVVHIDEGFDFLGFHIQRKRRRGSNKQFVYTYPSKKAVQAVKAKVRTLTNKSSATPPRATLLRINAVLRGWANYFRHGVSKRIFGYLDHYTWQRVGWWLRKRHGWRTWHAVKRRYGNGSGYTIDGLDLHHAASIPVTRYRYRGTRIPTPWMTPTPT